MNQKRKKVVCPILKPVTASMWQRVYRVGGEHSSGEPATCTIEISCETVLDHMEELKETKKSLSRRMDRSKKDNGLIYHRRVSLIF